MSTTEETPVPATDESVQAYASSRSQAIMKIGIALTSEGVLFVWWIIVAVILHECSVAAAWLGLNELFAEIFRYVSSIGTLAVSLILVISDFVRELRRFWDELLGRS